MKLCTKQILNCNGCPDYEHRDFECGGMTADWCNRSDREILPKHWKDGIAEFCELEDVKE